MLSGNCWPLKKSKQYLEEGGIRVPCLMQWPRVISSGTVSAQPSIMMDASVTVLEAGGARKFVAKDRKLDGVNLLTFLTSKAEDDPANRSFGWRRRDWGPTGNYLRQEAYRSGDWKLIRTYKYLRNKKWSAEYNDELFNLGQDIGEVENLAEKMPQKYEQMKTSFDQWKTEVVNLEPKFLIPLRDQLGSPANLPDDIVLGFNTRSFEGKIHKGKTDDLVSDPVNVNGICKVMVKAGATPPLLHAIMDVDTKKYSKMMFEMKISKGREIGAGRAVLRHTDWKGDDLLFKPIADGKWHEYVIDCTESDAWSQWSSSGRIGIALPVPTKGEVEISLKTIKLAQ
jgi:hypothetical protein